MAFSKMARRAGAASVLSALLATENTSAIRVIGNSDNVSNSISITSDSNGVDSKKTVAKTTVTAAMIKKVRDYLAATKPDQMAKSFSSDMKNFSDVFEIWVLKSIRIFMRGEELVER
jgi:hypothetical protein